MFMRLKRKKKFKSKEKKCEINVKINSRNLLPYVFALKEVEAIEREDLQNKLFFQLLVFFGYLR